MNRSTHDREKRLANLKREVTRRGFDRHASVLKDVQELPVELRPAALTKLPGVEPIQTIIVFPPQIQRGWHYVPKQAVLFTDSGLIHLIASIWPDQDPEVTYLKGCDLISLKVTLVLLYGLVEIVARGEHAPVRLEMEFNTVAWPCLSAPLRRLLGMTAVSAPIPLDEAACESALHQALDDLPLKFSNGVHIHGRLPGQQIEELVFQPSVWKPWLYFLRQKSVVNTLLVLTTDFLVIIQEEMKVEQGWILTYIPRTCMREIQNRSRDEWNELTLCLSRGDQNAEYRILLRSEVAQTWRSQWTAHGGRWFELPAATV